MVYISVITTHISHYKSLLVKRIGVNNCPLCGCSYCSMCIIALQPGPIKGVCSPPKSLLMSEGIPTITYIHVIYENNIQIHLKIDSPLPGFKPGTNQVASRHANHWATMTWCHCRIEFFFNFTYSSVYSHRIAKYNGSLECFKLGKKQRF